MKVIKIFDFDATLMHTLDLETGKKIYLEKTGEEYPYQGWWGRKESLDLKIFDIQPIQEILDIYKHYVETNQQDMYLLTGRLIKLEKEVMGVLEHHNLTDFTRVFCNNSGKTTLEFKTKLIKRLVEDGDFDELHFYDDREIHQEAFVELFESLGIKYIFNQVKFDPKTHTTTLTIKTNKDEESKGSL